MIFERNLHGWPTVWQIPKLGLGTWFIEDDKAAEAVRTRR